MVMLYTCEPCKRGDHINCQKATVSPQGYFGGKACKCLCRGRTREQMKADWLKVLEMTIGCPDKSEDQKPSDIQAGANAGVTKEEFERENQNLRDNTGKR